MTRLYIVDQSGLEPGGHYYAYTGCVVDGARRLGLDTTVLANKKFRLADGTAPQRIPISCPALLTPGPKRSGWASSGGNRATFPMSCSRRFAGYRRRPRIMCSCTLSDIAS